MRAADLIGSVVYDPDGAVVGHVRDLRLAAGGPPLGDSGEPAYRLVALDCGKIGAAHHLGYADAQMTGPWPLDGLLRAMAGHSLIVWWQDVVRIEGRRVHIRLRRGDLRSVRQGNGV